VSYGTFAVEYKREPAARIPGVYLDEEMDLTGLSQLLGRTLFIVAHPDDESISAGGLLQHMREPCVVFVTDGAPEDQYFWGRYGSRHAYAAIREKEARDALAAVGVKQAEFIARKGETSLIDQKLFTALPLAFAALSEIVDRVRPTCLLTLAYEGGHPDHDAVSFLGAQLGTAFRLPVWETPLYHRSGNGSGVYQAFVEEHGEVIEHLVKDSELDAKMRMLGCYKSQFDALPSFRPELERFRPQAHYNYGRRPHAGKLNYEHWQWPMTPEEVCAAFAKFSPAGEPVKR
jgi:N-acetylglucosamine malate deacetylase 2